MAGESQLQPESVPDPTVLTTDAIARAVKAERDYVDGQIKVLQERLTGIDRATEVLDNQLNRTPTEIQKASSHLRDVLEAKIAGMVEFQLQRKSAVDKHFEHLDKVRAEDKREARSLVDLALANQKEASAVALTNANKAIDKAQESTEKRYDTLDKAVQEIRVAMAAMMPRKESEARHSAHEQAVSALISRTTAIEATKVGGKEQLSGIYAMAGFIVSLFVIVGVLAAAGVFKTT